MAAEEPTQVIEVKKDTAFQRLDAGTQTVKLQTIEIVREINKLLANSELPIALEYKNRNRVAYTFAEVMVDHEKKDYLSAINRYHAGRDIGVIKSQFESALRVANIYLEYGLYEYAKRLFTSLLGNEDTAVASLARYYLARHDYIREYWDDALAGFESVRDGLPHDLMDTKWIQQGIILQSRKRHEQAVSVFKNVPDTSPFYAHAQFNIAMSELRQGWWSDAENRIRAVIPSLSKLSDIQLSLRDRFYIALGYSQLQRKYYREAVQSLEQVSTNGPFTYKARLGLGLVAAEQERYQDALEYMNGLMETYSRQLVTEEAHVVAPFLLESMQSVQASADYYKNAADYFVRAVKELQRIIRHVEKGDYDKQLFTKPRADLSGYQNAKQKPLKNDLHRYTVELRKQGRWQQINRNYHDLQELIVVLENHKRRLDLAAKDYPNAHAGLVKEIAGVLTKISELSKRYNVLQRESVADSLKSRLEYFVSYFSQSQFALARVYDAALGAQTQVKVGEVTVDEEYVREVYRNYLKTAGKKSINRRAAMVRLAELEMDYYDQLMADEGTQKQNEQKALVRLNISIELMNNTLQDYPDNKSNDRLLYDLIQAYDKSKDKENSVKTMRMLVDNHPESQFYTEVQFKLGEVYLTGNESIDAELAYSAALRRGNDSSTFYRRALYKRAWSRLRQSVYMDSLEDFFEVLRLSDYGDHRQMTLAEQELYDDILRGISLCFTNLGGLEPLNQYFVAKKDSPFKSAVYRKLSEIYLSQERRQDAVGVMQAYIEHFSDSAAAPQFQLSIIDAWSGTTSRDKELGARKVFDSTYALDNAFWKKHNIVRFKNIRDALKDNMHYLSSYYHNQYQLSKYPMTLADAKYWYERFFRFFPKEEETAKTHFLYAELLSDTGNLANAAEHYDIAVNQETDKKANVEAAYARIVTADNLLKQAKDKNQRTQWMMRKMQYTLAFAESYPVDSRTDSAMLHIIESLFDAEDFRNAIFSVDKLPANVKVETTEKALLIKAHSLMAIKEFQEAEQQYAALAQKLKENKLRAYKIMEGLGTAIYKQGETAVNKNEMEKALELFAKVQEKAPASEVAAVAQFDAAALLIKQKAFQSAIVAYEQFKQRYSTHKLIPEVTKKLAVLYLESEDAKRSAREFETIAEDTKNSRDVRQNALYQAADLYAKSGENSSAIRLLLQYENISDIGVVERIEAQYKLSDLYTKQGNQTQQVYWQQKLINAEQAAGSLRSERTNYLASLAIVGLADIAKQKYESIALSQPLKDSLIRKKNTMQEAIDKYAQIRGFGIVETTTKASFQIADLYYNFSKAILGSPRPQGLSEIEAEQYELLLEEQAFPFEEKAIQFLKSNTEYVKDGVYDEWIASSFSRLAQIVPAIFDKQEKLKPFIEVVQPDINVASN